MRILLAGTAGVAVPSLETLAASRHELLGVITRPDAPAGRGRQPKASAVAEAAGRLGLPALKPVTPGDPDFLDALAALAPDAIAVVGYGALLPPAALAIPRHGWVNLHFSLLPAWRGAAPVAHAILAGDDIIGATTFQIVAALDAGPVFGTMTYRLAPRTTTGQALADLAHGGDRLLLDTLDHIEAGTASPIAQVGPVSLAPKLTPADARIDWRRPWTAIDRRIRACLPEPGPWTTWRGGRLGLGVLAVDDAGGPAGSGLAGGPRVGLAPGQVAAGGRPAAEPPAGLAPGRVVAGKDAVWVGTGTEPARLGEVRPAGKKWMDAAAWARGARIDPDETLGHN